MKLYGFAPSPNTWQVRALAAHIGVPVDFVPLDFAKGDTKTAAFLAVNPTGRTPALTDGDFKLWETLALMQYIAGKKSNSLWADDPRTRADIARWQSWNLAHWTRDAWAPVLSERVVKKLFNLGPSDEAVIAKGIEAFGKEAAMLDAHLAKRKVSGRRCARRSRTSPSRRRCSTPRRRNCRSHPIRICARGRSASWRCRAGRRPRRSSPPRRVINS